MSKKRSAFSSAKALTLAAMLTAMSVVIGVFCKNFLNFGFGLYRITFENFPIILSGIFFGPVAGGIVGAATDIVSYLLSSQEYPPNLIVTFGAITVGAISGIVSRFIVKKSGIKQIIFSGAAAHIIGSMIIKSIGLFQYYGWMVVVRVPMYIVIASAEIALVCMMYKNKNFRKMFDDVKRSEIKIKKRREEDELR